MRAYDSRSVSKKGLRYNIILYHYISMLLLRYPRQIIIETRNRKRAYIYYKYFIILLTGIILLSLSNRYYYGRILFFARSPAPRFVVDKYYFIHAPVAPPHNNNFNMISRTYCAYLYFMTVLCRYIRCAMRFLK